MIGSLRGRVLDHSGTELLVEVGGLGYRVQATASTIAGAGGVGSEVFLHVHHHRREDAETLYGFTSADERRVFETLIGTHGVGPALGLAILGVHTPAGLRLVLATEDVDALCMVPGVGKKTAARLLIELRSRLELPDVDLSATAVAGGPSSRTSLSDVREALSELGYGSDEISRALSDLPGADDSSELLRGALRRLAEAS